MGDRTTTVLTVLNQHVDQVEAIDDMNGEVLDVQDEVTQIIYYDINYGDLNGYVPDGEMGMLDKMQAANIPYDVEWEAGCEYPRGGDSFRVLEDGTPSLTEIPSFDSQGMVSITDVMKLIQPALSDTGVTSYAVDAVNDIHEMVAQTKVRDFPPFTLIENGEFL